MAEQNTIEEKTATAILEKPITVTIGSTTFNVARPSAATLILASAELSHLPAVNTNGETKIYESLAYAKECAPLGRIAAIIILGAKAASKKSKNPLWRRILRLKPKPSAVDRLAKTILEELSPSELNGMMAELLGSLQMADFFGLTTFLIGINLTRTTKVERPTASGQR